MLLWTSWVRATAVVAVVAAVPTQAVAQGPSPGDSAARGAREALLAPGDVVRVYVWREPDLSGDFTLDADGTAALPRIGSVPASAIPPDSIRKLIVGTYSVSLVNPAIQVTFLHRLRVLGAVRNPGLYMVETRATVADALALAGGATDNGSYDRVHLIHRVAKSSAWLAAASTLADHGVGSGDELFVPERSWASRNTAGLAGSLLTAAAVLGAAVLR